MARLTKVLLLATVIWGTAWSVSAQTCPVKHPSLTALDHASMLAAYTASFQGLYGRPPTLHAGSGVDDGNYWIAVSDHFGEFSDGVCRAGWSAYWEAKLAGSDSAPPSLGDQPARFRPDSTPPPVVTPPVVPLPTPQPAPLPSVDLNAVLNALTIVQTTAAKCATEEQVAQLSANVDQFHAEARQTVKDALVFITKYAGPVIAAVFAGRATK